MKTPARELEKLERLLRQAYRKKKPVEVDPHWEKRLMARIREASAPQEGPRFLPMFEHLVWRLTPVASLAVVILVALLFKLEFASAHYALQSLLTGLEDLTWAQIFST